MSIRAAKGRQHCAGHACANNGGDCQCACLRCQRANRDADFLAALREWVRRGNPPGALSR